jgi:hypothetical protein
LSFPASLSLIKISASVWEITRSERTSLPSPSSVRARLS